MTVEKTERREYTKKGEWRMGIIRAIRQTIGGTLADQWLEVIEPENMGDQTVLTAGIRTGKGANRKGGKDSISNGSVIHVYEGQFMMLLDGGRIVDYSAEPGYFIVDNSSMPSMFSGSLDDVVKNSFDRFRFGGTAPTSQKVLYLNLQEIKGIRFGTRNPISYFDNFYNAELFLRAHGTYSIRITDPIKFYVEAIPKNKDQVEITDINEQYLYEFLDALQSSINQMSADGMRISYVQSKSRELSKYMAETLDEDWKQTRGMEIQAVAIASLSYDDKSQELLNMRNQGAMLQDPSIREGYMQGAFARGMEAAGSNANGSTMDNSSMPSMFSGSLDDVVKNSFDRFRFGGTAPTSQKVLYLNLQEIKGIRFGTRNPISYFDNFYNAELFLRAHGTYSIRITDPIKFYVEAIPKNKDQVEITDINEQYLYEFLDALQSSINQMSADGMRISYVQSKSRELSKYMAETLDEDWKQTRGMEIQAVAIASLSYDDKSQELLNMRNQGAMLQDPSIREGYMQGAFARGMEAAGSNANGSTMGFMGMQMGAQMGGNMAASMSAANQQQMIRNQQMQQEAATAHHAQNETDIWICSCGQKNTGKFCSECGRPRQTGAWICSCGQKNTGKFCSECGKSRP